MGVVKDVASTNGTTQRFDIGKSSDLNSQDSTGGSDSLTPYLTIDNGDVGIGTTSPAYKLDVHGTSNVGVLTTTSVSGNGSGLTSLNADNITSGTLGRPISTTTGTFSGVVTCNDVLKLEAGSTTGDTSVESTHKTNTYIRFGAAGSSNDWAYLRQIGGDNLIKLALDFHDDNEARFEIRKVNSSGNSGSSEVATTVFSVDNGAVTATSFSGSGSSLTSLNADNLSSGTVPSARLSLAASDIPDLSASKITSGTLGRPISTTTGTFSGLLTASGGVRSYKDGVVAEFQPATSGEYTLINFHSKVNSGSDRGFILVQDESATSPGAGSEDLRMTIGVHNDFRSSASHSDELWFQGGGRLVYNVGSWDSELDTIIGTPGVGTTGGHEWRVNNSTKVVINHSGNVGIGTTSPGSLLTIESTTGNQMRLNYNADWYNIIERDSSGDLNFLEKAGASASLKNLMTIKTGGNVGIGNTNPAFPLSIGTGDGNKILFNQSGTTPGHNITCSSGWQWNFNAARSGQDDDAKITFNISGSSGYDEIMRVNSTGVGIGTTSPSAKLHIGPNNDDHIYLASANNAYGWKIDTDDQGSGEVPFRIIKRLGGSDATALTIKNQNGNVGIGTTSPATKLDVAGVGRFTSNGGSVQLVGTDHTYLEYYPDGTSAGRKAYVGYASATDNNFTISNSAGSGHIILGFGNVGIGETSPSYKLDVNGETRVGNVLYIGKNTDDETAKTIYFGGTAGDNAYDHCVIERRVWSTGTEKQELLLFSGNDPVTTAGPDRIRLKGAQILFDTYTGASTDRAAESTRMIIRADGNVGIGTTSPGYALTIRKNTNTLLLESENAGVQSNVNIDFKNYDAQDPPGARITARDDGVYGSHLFFSTRTGNGSSLSEKLRIASNGNVGVGTTTPHAKLHVNGGAGGISSALRVYFKYNDYNSSYISLQLNNGGWGPMSIYASDDIVTAAYIVSHSGTIGASDTRIKKNIVDANDAECLETLRLLKPKKYQYKDEVDRGTEPVWGFIAQEVRETLPYATELRRDVLPNIYELANVSQSNVITFTNFNTSNLESNATTLIRTKGIDGEDHDIHLAEVIDEHTIRVEEDLSEWTGSVDETGNAINEITTTTITPEEYNALEDTSGYIANITGYQNANVVISVEEYNALEDTAGYEEIIDNYTKTTTTYPGTQLFVYGQEVDDFFFLKKDAIWTVATAALQEVDRQLQAEKARNDALEARIAALENA